MIKDQTMEEVNSDFSFNSERFADINILRYRVDGFEDMSLQEKKFIYYMSQATLVGRDILWDQNCICNLKVRELLEAIFKGYKGCRSCDEFISFLTYLKRIWFSNGIHHHYSMDRITIGFSEEYFNELISDSSIPESLKSSIEEVSGVLFNPDIYSKRVVLDSDKDIIEASANNYYQGVTQEEVENFYSAKATENRADFRDGEEPMWGLNSTLVKNSDGVLEERVWHLDGLYGAAIAEIIYWLEKAKGCCSIKQSAILSLLISYYKSGDLKTFDEYSIEWVQDLEGDIDYINGFIEVYGDSLGIKGSWEAIVTVVDREASKRTTIISENADWFEANSPTDRKYKKEEVSGVSAKVVKVAMLGGDCYPATPIGINLPNSEWIRETHGSKSVTIDNITEAYNKATLKSPFLAEFALSDSEINRAREYGHIGGNLHTDLHECLGHGSGKLMPGVGVESLKNNYSTIEETRADLFALYFMPDQKMMDISLIDSPEVAKAEYDAYIRNGLLTQLVRVEKGQNIEESHMRNRQLIAKWAYELGRGEVIEEVKQSGKRYYKINSYEKLRDIFGEQLKEIQRVKSEGDYAKADYLIRTYGVEVDQELHQEVLDRYAALNLAPYSGFVNPVYRLVEEGGEIVDVTISYDQNFTEQMLNYSEFYSLL